MAIKKTLEAAGGVGFTYPACSAPAYVSGQTYTAGQNVSYHGLVQCVHRYGRSKGY